MLHVQPKPVTPKPADLARSLVLTPEPLVVDGISSEEDERQLEALNAWVAGQGLHLGEIAYDFSDPATGEQQAVFDLACPLGIQSELSQPVAVLLNEGAETIAIANEAGFRCFTSAAAFQRYVESEILTPDLEEPAEAIPN